MLDMSILLQSESIIFNWILSRESSGSLKKETRLVNLFINLIINQRSHHQIFQPEIYEYFFLNKKRTAPFRSTSFVVIFSNKLERNPTAEKRHKIYHFHKTNSMCSLFENASDWIMLRAFQMQYKLNFVFEKFNTKSTFDPNF